MRSGLGEARIEVRGVGVEAKGVSRNVLDIDDPQGRAPFIVEAMGYRVHPRDTGVSALH
jgi:hypothetical protein